MISIDDHPPPDPSSYDSQNHQHRVSHDLKIKIGEKASASDIDLLKPTDTDLDDTNNRLPNFSIRDYVFGSRSEDITCNWPFSHESLRLCFDYGVKNFLPPFQSLDSLRSNSYVSSEETISRFDGKLKVDQSVSQCHVEENLAQRKPRVKKCKFITKSNFGIEPIEEVTRNNFIMASKVCPVCKTFASSSNTTLNAHIDRCLSEESSMKWTENPKIMVKHRIKPRKTRLMVDIYETAPRCTVEELDRRNGTNWASNSVFPDQELEAEEENEQPQKQAFIPEVVDHEGSVYIDTDGTKVRILSMPKVGTSDYHEPRKLQKGGKGTKMVMEKKKKKVCEQKGPLRFLKHSRSSKKFSSLKPHHGASEARCGQEEDISIERSFNKKDGGENPMKADQVHNQMEDLAITRPPWACSKRTALAKKRLPVLTKPKEGTTLDDSCEDPPSIRLNMCKFSYLKKNPSSASQEHDLGPKLNPKRKVSALKKSNFSCLAMENTGPSQDSFKHKSRMEEDTSGKLPFDIVNVLEAKKKKSVTSEDSSGGLEITLESDQVGVMTAPRGSDVQGSFMGLRNSLDDEFSKLVNQSNNKFGSRECIDMYQDQLSSPKRALDDTETIPIAHNIEKQGTYFQEVDPIPIPGPPGSFLPPSPGGDMVSEELQGNSSLTTMSRVQTSEDKCHNGDYMSESPISTVSTPSFTKSGTGPDEKVSLRFTSSQDACVMVDVVDKASSVFQNDQPCCCSRKEGVFSKNVPSYPQESALLRKQALESNRRSDLFSLINCPTIPPPPSAGSPPVLRLMGKNLTVVKTDDEQCRPMTYHHNIQNNQNSSFYGYPSQHPTIFSNNQNVSTPHHFNVHPPSNLRNLEDSRPIHAFDTLFPSTTNAFDTQTGSSIPGVRSSTAYYPRSFS